MKNGLYKASFKTPIGQGTGVVVIADGIIKGGDASMYYIGTFKENVNNITATLHIGKHSDIPGRTSVFGLDDVRLEVKGTSIANSAKLQGSAMEAPTVPFEVRLTLIE